MAAPSPLAARVVALAVLAGASIRHRRLLQNGGRSAPPGQGRHGQADGDRPTGAARRGAPSHDAAGRPHTLAEFKGKVVLVNLWANWCAPCKLEIPSLAKLQAAYAGKPLAVVPISLGKGEDETAGRAFIASNPPLAFYSDPSYRLAYAFPPVSRACRPPSSMTAAAASGRGWPAAPTGRARTRGPWWTPSSPKNDRRSCAGAEVEGVAARAWPAAHEERLGEWRLHASSGSSRRINPAGPWASRACRRPRPSRRWRIGTARAAWGPYSRSSNRRPQTSSPP